MKPASTHDEAVVTDLRGSRPAPEPHERQEAAGEAWSDLDRVLELLERREITPGEIRLLVKLIDDEATVTDLAAALDRPQDEVASSARWLTAQGLIRRRAGRDDEPAVLAITSTGIAAVRPVLTAAGFDPRGSRLEGAR